MKRHAMRMLAGAAALALLAPGTARAEENLALLRLLDDGWRVFRGRTGQGAGAREEVRFVCEKCGKLS